MGFPAYEQLRQVTPLTGIVLCNNPSPMTMEGTNSVIVRAGSGPAVIIDPGPDDAHHLDRLAAIDNVALVLVTHRHPDHTGGIDGLVARTQLPVRALDARWCRNAQPLVDGECIALPGLRLGIVATPGHTADSIAITIAAADAPAGTLDSIMLADTILGRDSTVLDSSDGSLADYLDSLATLARIGRGVVGLPSHGPDVADTGAAAVALTEHRIARLEQVRAARAELGAQASAAELTRHIYTEISDPLLLVAAEQSTRVALEYLATR